MMDQTPNNHKLRFIIGIIVGLLLIMVFIYNTIISKKNAVTTITPTISLPTPLPIDNSFLTPTGLTQEQTQKQIEADKNWSSQSKQIDSDYPWLDSFPIQNDDYFLYFDVSEKKFIAKIYTGDKIEQIKTEISSLLTNIGIEENKYPIEWRVEQ